MKGNIYSEIVLENLPTYLLYVQGNFSYLLGFSGILIVLSKAGFSDHGAQLHLARGALFIQYLYRFSYFSPNLTICFKITTAQLTNNCICMMKQQKNK